MDIYRGYGVVKEPNEREGGFKWMIYKDDRFVCQQPSEDFAYHWIDEQKRYKP